MYNLCLYVLSSLWAFDTAASKILIVHVPYHICVYDNKLDLTYVSLTDQVSRTFKGKHYFNYLEVIEI